MNVADNQSNDKDDCSRSKHIIGPLLWIRTHPVPIEHHVLAEAGQAVYPSPGEGQYNRQEHAGQHGHKN